MKDFVIKINYSMKNKEENINIQKDSRFFAFLYMLELAKQEVVNSMTEDYFQLDVNYDCDTIDLLYGYDNKYCHYKLIQKIYCIVISKFDSDGNRIDAWEMGCDTNIENARQSKQEYEQRLKDGEFKDFGNNLEVEIEVRDYESNDLIEIID